MALTTGLSTCPALCQYLEHIKVLYMPHGLLVLIQYYFPSAIKELEYLI